jgi:hypothetical protein
MNHCFALYSILSMILAFLKSRTKQILIKVNFIHPFIIFTYSNCTMPYAHIIHINFLDRRGDQLFNCQQTEYFETLTFFTSYNKFGTKIFKYIKLTYFKIWNIQHEKFNSMGWSVERPWRQSIVVIILSFVLKRSYFQLYSEIH